MMGYYFIKAHTLLRIMRHILVFQTLIAMHSFVSVTLICIYLHTFMSYE